MLILTFRLKFTLVARQKLIVCADECCGSKAGMRAREAFPSGARVLPLPSLPAPWLLRQQCVSPSQQLAEQ